MKINVNMQMQIPAMILQIPVENAIKHGVMPLDRKKKLNISIKHCETNTKIEITDNGIGLKNSAGRTSRTGTGLKVLYQTIQMLNKQNQEKTVTITDRNQDDISFEETIVKILIPNNFKTKIQ